MGLVIFAALSSLFFVSQVSFKDYRLFIYLGFVWFLFRCLFGTARLALVETMGDQFGRDVRLYRTLRWALLTSGCATAFMIVAQQLPVGYEVQDFFNRLFMLVLFALAIVLLRGWAVVPGLIEQHLSWWEPRRYVKRALRLFSFLFPLGLLSIAVLGFLGYRELAWTISVYEGLFLIYLVGYIVARGLLMDFTNWLSDYIITNTRNGWLIVQAVLVPLDKVLRITLLLGGFLLLFSSYGWNQDSYIVIKLYEILFWTLLPLPGLDLSLYHIIMIGIISAVLFWLGRWTYEFAYRWLFARIRDLGVRNSLSVFSQYLMVVVGILIAIRVLGIELTGLVYVFSFLALGIGFGLRDLANNFVSGWLLLIERPLRQGDLVSIGGFEGEVTHIGMRSIRVHTWDRMEVLVPNSEVFTKSFTNWTHQDSIIRSIINIKVNRDDDPHFVQKIIEETLQEMVEIEKEPRLQVLLKEVGNMHVEIEARYFINLSKGISRAEIRSRVQFAIWDQFKFYGIKPPYPVQDIYVKQLPDGE